MFKRKNKPKPEKKEEIYEILYQAKEITMRLQAGEKLTNLKNKFISLLTKRSFA